MCEEGDTEYDQELLTQTKTAVVYMDSLAEMTPQRLEELELLYNPERVLLEWNGMWNQDEAASSAGLDDLSADYDH